jgi:hypothetical protein
MQITFNHGGCAYQAIYGVFGFSIKHSCILNQGKRQNPQRKIVPVAAVSLRGL